MNEELEELVRTIIAFFLAVAVVSALFAPMTAVVLHYHVEYIKVRECHTNTK